MLTFFNYTKHMKSCTVVLRYIVYLKFNFLFFISYFLNLYLFHFILLSNYLLNYRELQTHL